MFTSKTHRFYAVLALAALGACEREVVDEAPVSVSESSCSDAPGDDWGAIPDLIISEVVPSPAIPDYLNGNDWVELQNAGTAPVCLGVYSIKDSKSELTKLPEVILQPGEFYVIEAADKDAASEGAFLPFKLGKEDSVSLYAEGNLVHALAWKPDDAKKGQSFGKLSGDTKVLYPTPGSDNVPYELFSDSEVFTVKIKMSDANYGDLARRPLAKQWYPADLEFNGAVITDISVRAKGSSSLRNVGRLQGDHRSYGRYSFKIAFNKQKNQKFMGMKRLVLNNGYGDPTLMRDAIAYRVMAEAGMPASRVSYVDLWVADKHLGVYQMIEPVDGEYVEKYFPADYASHQKGNLYKAFSSLEWKEGQTLKNFTAGRSPQLELKTNRGTAEANEGDKSLMAFLESINSGSSDLIDTDNVTRYIAAMTLISNYDSYFANRGNYYLYEHLSAKGFAMIPWDFNLGLGRSIKKGKPCEDPAVLINHPTVPPIAERPIIARVLERDGLRSAYHSHLQALLANIFNPDDIRAFVHEKKKLIDPYVKRDPTSFYSYDEWNESFTEDVSGSADLFGKAGALIPFIDARYQNVKRQLSGEITAGDIESGPCP